MFVTRGKYVAISSFHFSHPEWLFSFLHLNKCPFLSLPSWKTVPPWWPCGFFRNHSRGCGGGSARRRSFQRTGPRWSHTAARLDLQDSQQSTIRTTRNPSSIHNYIHWCVVPTTCIEPFTTMTTRNLHRTKYNSATAWNTYMTTGKICVWATTGNTLTDIHGLHGQCWCLKGTSLIQASGSFSKWSMRVLLLL